MEQKTESQNVHPHVRIVTFDDGVFERVAKLNIPELNGKEIRFDDYRDVWTMRNTKMVEQIIEYLKTKKQLNEPLSLNDFLMYFELDCLEKTLYADLIKELSAVANRYQRKPNEHHTFEYYSKLKMNPQAVALLNVIQNQKHYYVRDEIKKHIESLFEIEKDSFQNKDFGEVFHHTAYSLLNLNNIIAKRLQKPSDDELNTQFGFLVMEAVSKFKNAAN